MCTIIPTTNVLLNNSISEETWIQCQSCLQIFCNASSLLQQHEQLQHHHQSHQLSSTKSNFKIIQLKPLTIQLQNVKDILKNYNNSKSFGDKNSKNVPRRLQRSNIKNEFTSSDININVKNDDDEDEEEFQVHVQNSESESDYDSDFNQLSMKKRKKRKRKKNRQESKKPKNNKEKSTATVVTQEGISITIDPVSGKEIFTCTFCSSSTITVTFDEFNQLKTHLEEKHVSSQTFQCTICDKLFHRQEHLKKHASTHKKNSRRNVADGKYSCSICKRTYKDKKTCERHKRKVHSPKIHQCSYCNKKFAEPGIRKAHETLVHLKNSIPMPFACKYCDKKFPKIYLARHHELKHIASKLYACNFCSKRFWTGSARQHHEDNLHRKLNRESWTYCIGCGKGFKLEKSLKTHHCALSMSKEIHEAPIEFRNETLGEEEVDPLLITKQEAEQKTQENGEDDKALPFCQVDPERLIIKEDEIDIEDEGTMPSRFNSQLSEEPEQKEVSSVISNDGFILPNEPNINIMSCIKSETLHEPKTQATTKIKLPKKGTACPACPKSFQTRSQLSMHIRRHNLKLVGNKYECDFPCCGKKLASPWGLEVHRQSHTGLNSYKCEECGSCFKTKHGHKYHVACAHTNDKPYKCSYCNASFVTSQTKDLHEQSIHIKEQKFKCNYCEKTFVFKKYLVLHERSHTGEKPLLCSYCGKGFARYNARTDHIKKHLKQFAANK